jgi:GAF domain-containing protein
VREAPYATLVLADKRRGGDFAAEDKELVGLLGAQAAVAIENARRYESATRWLHQLEL